MKRYLIEADMEADNRLTSKTFVYDTVATMAEAKTLGNIYLNVEGVAGVSIYKAEGRNPGKQYIRELIGTRGGDKQAAGLRESTAEWENVIGKDYIALDYWMFEDEDMQAADILLMARA